MNEEVNLQELVADEHMHVFTLLLWKYGGRGKPMCITEADVNDFCEQYPKGCAVALNNEEGFIQARFMSNDAADALCKKHGGKGMEATLAAHKAANDAKDD